MLSKMKYSRNNENAGGTQLKRQISGYVLKDSATFRLENRSMKSRIRELEEEVDKLRITVKFFQETFLLDD